MKFKNVFLSVIATLSLTLSSQINVAHAGLVRGTDLQIHRSIDSDKYQETATSGDRTRSMAEFSLGWDAYKKDEHLSALEHFSESVKLDPNNPYAYMGLAIVSGKTSEYGPAFMKHSADLFEKEGNQEGYDLAIEWLQAAVGN
jgi:tetratricopeptide (TPR) repeat protein